MNVQELRQKKGELVTQADQILKRAAEDGRMGLNKEEGATFDKIHEDVEALTRDIQRLEKQESLMSSEGRVAPPVAPDNGGRRVSEPMRRASKSDRAEALRSWFMAGSDEEVTREQREAAQRAGVNLDRKNLTIKLAPFAPTSTRREDVREWEQRVLEVDETSPNSGGHYTVPDETMRALEVSLLAHGGMRRVATVLRTASGADLPFPTVNDTANEGAILGESTEATTQDPTFNQLVLESYKYSSKIILVSVEFLQDSAINAAEVIGRLLGERIARITNKHFTIGDGSSKPNGIVTAAGNSSVTTSASTTITYDNIIDLKHSVDPAYREMGATFMFNDTTLKLLKKIKIPQFSGDTNGQPLWRAGLATGEPDTIDGDPYVINQQMESGASKKAIVYGALSKYQIRDVRDVTLLRLDERYAEFHQVAFLAFSRHDGDLLDAGTDPVKYLTMGS